MQSNIGSRRSLNRLIFPIRLGERFQHYSRTVKLRNETLLENTIIINTRDGAYCRTSCTIVFTFLLVIILFCLITFVYCYLFRAERLIILWKIKMKSGHDITFHTVMKSEMCSEPFQVFNAKHII